MADGSLNPTRRRRRRLWLAISATALVVAVGGATGGWLYWSSLASDLGSPPVTWPNGEPSGPLEDNVWGQRYREAERQLNLAYAFGDFSDPRLIDAVGYEYATRAASLAGRIREYLEDDPSTFASIVASAQKTVLMSITEGEDGTSAQIAVCGEWYSDYKSAYVLPQMWEFHVTENGDVVGDTINSLDVLSCRDNEPQPAQWSPELDVTGVNYDHPKPPAPKWYYEWTGVID